MTMETKAPSTRTVESAPVADVPLAPLPDHWRSLPRAFVHRARSQPGAEAMADSTGASLTYGQTFLRSLALGRVLARTLGPSPYVGVMIPPTVPAAVVNVSLALWGKIAVNLNYTANQRTVDSAIDQTGLTHVLTSKKVLDRVGLQPKGTVVLLEELAKEVGLLDKLWAATVSKAVPISALGSFLPGLKGDGLEETATIIFTSGSTGDPKGVVLSHRNILSNAHAINLQVRLEPTEVVLGILPLFHSFGTTVTLWTALCLGLKTVYHINPLDARVVGKLCQDHGVTIIIGTPTFMRTYLQRCDREQFQTVRRVILGAEKLKPELARDIRETLQIEPLEGYGCTETGPVISVNVDHEIQTPDGRPLAGNRLGTVGRPLPGTAIKTVDPETGADLPRGTEGLIHVQGPQVMVGYHNREEATAKVLKDGWYNTGDLGLLDADGFLKITDRMSRFAKIGGEMVPHLAVESAILEATGATEQAVAVTSLPDPKRGERLVVIHTKELGMPPSEIVRKISETGLPRLWVPSAEEFLEFESIPVLGTGKLDLRRLRELARERSHG
ncbi:hypothetical protein BH23PLA1_BH23PLA1_29140 [soil metagenome]